MVLVQRTRNVGKPCVTVVHDGRSSRAAEAGNGKGTDDELNSAVGNGNDEEHGDIDKGG